MASQIPQMALPGTILAPITTHNPGPGTHIHAGNVVSSLLGTVTVTPPTTSAPTKRPTKLSVLSSLNDPSSFPTISVSRKPSLPQSAPRGSKAGGNVLLGGGSTTIGGENKGPGANFVVGKRELLPEVGDVVLCRVLRLMSKQAIVGILQVGGTVLGTEWQGVIRSQDVRATEKDKVKIQEAFKPGDVVRANVISLGDQANYFLSTASNELGVIMATSDLGNDMVPISWKEFRDPETGISESRKVAKPY